MPWLAVTTALLAAFLMGVARSGIGIGGFDIALLLIGFVVS